MYNAQITKDRIKAICKSKKINMEDMLISCNLGVNAIRQINDTKGLASFSLAKIADYLNVSVDYLLGRVDTPNGTYSITGDNNVQVNGNNSPTTVTTSKHSQQDTITEEFIQTFKTLTLADKIAVMDFAISKVNK